MKRFLLLTAIIAIGWTFSAARADEQEFLKYEDLLQKIEAGKVKSLSLGPLDYMEGSYVQGSAEVEFFSRHPLTPSNDPLLTRLLEAKKVSVVKKERPKPGTVELLTQNAPGLLLLVVPSVLLVFVIIYVVRINNKIDQVVIK